MNKFKKMIKIALKIGGIAAVIYISSKYSYEKGIKKGKRIEFEDVYALAISNPDEFFDLLEYKQDLTNLSAADIDELKTIGMIYKLIKMKEFNHG